MQKNNVPLPKSFRPEVRAQQQAIAFQQSQAQKNQASQQGSSTNQTNELEAITKFYYQEYGPTQGERYKDIYFLEKEIEQLKSSGANPQKIYDTQVAINRKLSDIAKTAGAGKGGLKGPGITSTIQKKSGTYIIEKGEVTGYLPVGGYSPIGSTVASEKYFLQKENGKSMSPLIGGYSPISGEDLPFSIGGENVIPFSSSKGKGFTTTSGKFYSPVASKDKDLFSPIEQKKSKTKGGSVSIKQANQILGQSIENTIFGEQKEKQRTEKFSISKEQAEYGYSQSSSKIPIIQIAKEFTSETDKISKGTGLVVGKLLTPKRILKRGASGKVELFETPTSRIKESQLGATQIIGIGQYFIPIYGEAKGASDIITEIGAGKGQSILESVVIGAGAYAGLKIVSKGASATRGFILSKEAKGIEATYSAMKAEKAFSIKAYDKAISGIEIGVPSAFLAYEGLRFQEKKARLPVQELSSLQQEAIEESRTIPAINIGFIAGSKISAGARESILRLQGKEYLEYEKIANPEVLSGTKRFPETRGPPSKLVKKFSQSYGPFQGPGGFTATTSRFPKTFPVGTGKSETPGLYISPEVSEFFLRLRGSGISESYSFRPRLLDEAGSPLIGRIKIPVRELPSNIVRRFRGIRFVKPAKGQSSRQVIANLEFTKLPKGNAFTSFQFTYGQKVESEAIIVPGTILDEKAFRYFTKVKGEAVPIREFGVSNNQLVGKGLTSQGISSRIVDTERYFSRPRLRIGARISPNEYKESNTSRSSMISKYSVVSSYQRPSIVSSIIGSNRKPIRSVREPLPSYRPPRFGRERFEYVPRKGVEYVQPVKSYKSIIGSSKGTPFYPTRSPPRYPTLSPPRRPPSSPPPRRLSIPEYRPDVRRDVRPGFIGVFYRKGKPLKTISNIPLIESEARALGAKAVDEPILRSFKLIRRGYATPKGIRGPVEILRRGKRDPSLYVEKSRYAISTGREKSSLRIARRNKLGSLLSRKSLLGRI